MNATLGNILAVARREFMWRARSRTYIVTTVVLVAVALAIALAPIVVRYVERGSGPETIGLHVGEAEPSIDVAVALEGLMNVTASSADEPEFAVVPVADLAQGREDVAGGDLKALVALARTATGDLAFTLVSKGQAFERTPQLIQQATTSIAIQDRLSRVGIPPIDQAALFAPPSFAFQQASDTPGSGPPPSMANPVGYFTIGFALQILIFMAIMLYGQWVAMSVAEEKSSRVMEVVLGAATPFQLLAGKVLGVGALGMAQYVVVFIPAMLGIVFQEQIASLVLGGSGQASLPEGLSVGLLAAFGVFFVLGFLLYAVLYAAAASLVSRQEDVNQIIAPLTILSVAGYMVAVYAGTGLIEMSGTVLAALSYVPFLSPYLMLSRLGMGQAGAPEAAIAIAILLVSIPVALWIAARIYAAGVLLYGQRPGFRVMLKALRGA